MRKPSGSQVVLTKDANLLEILIPSAGVFSDSTCLILSVLILCSIMAILTQFSLQNGFYDSGGLLRKILENLFLLFNFGTSAFFLLQVIFNVFGNMQFCLNQRQIFLTCTLFGIEGYRELPSPKRNITQLVRTKDSNNRPSLIIWAGMQKYELSTTTNFPLTTPEVDWLAHELSDWLGLPIIRE